MTKKQFATIIHSPIRILVLVSLLALTFPLSIAKADTVVNFPDPNLQAAIRQAIGKPIGDIHQSDLITLYILHASGRNITDITGLEYCTSLQFADLEGNQISNISSLSGLYGLESLYLGANQIGNVSPLSGLSDLRYLGLNSNQISNISPLSGLTSLTWLRLDSNQISDISPLSGLVNLTYLEIFSNEIGDISPLSSLNNLTELFLGGNNIINISALSGLNDLLLLDLAGNQVSNIVPLVNNSGLAQGDWVNLRINPLNADSIYVYIPQLQSRGVQVIYDIPALTPTPTPTPTPMPTTLVSGITREVNGNIQPGVSITLDGAGPVVGDQNGQYQIMAATTGSHTLVAHKQGFRDRTQTVNIAGLGPDYAVTCNFQGNYGLIPNAPTMQYALLCINKWLYPPNPDTGLDIQTVLDVINAWLYPVQ